MKNYALSPLIENFTMMTSSKRKINVIFFVENCLSYNISKSQLNKDKNDVIKKIHFLKFRCQYDDFVSLSTSQGGMKSYLQLMLFLTMI